MNSPFENTKIELPTFDTLEIDSELTKPENKGLFQKDKSIFSLFKDSLTPLKDENKEKNFPKYFANIDHKLFTYMGVLTDELKRDLYGYSSFENKDEYLGEYQIEAKEGFGVYKYKENENQSDIYIGDYKNNSKTGEGIYLIIKKKLENKEKPGTIDLINYDCAIGKFKDDLFIEGKIFSINYDKNVLFIGKVDEKGLPSDKNSLVFEGEEKIFRGIVENGKMVEGRNIFLKGGEKIKGYYFKRKEEENPEDQYEFEYDKDQEKDEESIQWAKKINVGEYRESIQNVYDKIGDLTKKFKNFETAKNVDFNNEVKNNILNEVNKLIKN